MNWKTLQNDIKLFDSLMNRFTEIGCTNKKAFELATYVFIYNLPIVIKTTIISDNNQNKRYNTN
jgi:hypothetical protein